MPILLNEDHVPSDGGKPFKHIDFHCPDHQALIQMGHRSVRLDRNPDKDRPLSEHRYRRCPWRGCFGEIESGIEPRLPVAAWILHLPIADGQHYVYIMRDTDARRAYIGYTANPRARFTGHWRKAHLRDGGIGWLHDHMKDDPAWAPDIELIPFAHEAEARAAERRLQFEPGDWAADWDISGTN
jgi:predicted GIY-YIG superfamily endonuclease